MHSSRVLNVPLCKLAKDLRSCHGESDIDLPGIFEELLFAIGDS
jgi:hypothetical protein